MSMKLEETFHIKSLVNGTCPQDLVFFYYLLLLKIFKINSCWLKIKSSSTLKMHKNTLLSHNRNLFQEFQGHMWSVRPIRCSQGLRTAIRNQSITNQYRHTAPVDTFHKCWCTHIHNTLHFVAGCHTCRCTFPVSLHCWQSNNLRKK